MINKKAVLAIVFSSLFTNVALANETGTITMNGSVTDATCQVSSDQLTRPINLATINMADLSSAADNASVGSTEINFDVTACPASTTNVGVQFDFTSDGNPNYLENTGDAQGVAFGITKSDDTLIITGQKVDAENLDSALGTATVNAKLHAYRLGSVSAVEGTIASTAIVTVITQ